MQVTLRGLCYFGVVVFVAFLPAFDGRTYERGLARPEQRPLLETRDRAAARWGSAEGTVPSVHAEKQTSRPGHQASGNIQHTGIEAENDARTSALNRRDHSARYFAPGHSPVEEALLAGEFLGTRTVAATDDLGPRSSGIHGCHRDAVVTEFCGQYFRQGRRRILGRGVARLSRYGYERQCRQNEADGRAILGTRGP